MKLNLECGEQTLHNPEKPISCNFCDTSPRVGQLRNETPGKESTSSSICSHIGRYNNPVPCLMGFSLSIDLLCGVVGTMAYIYATGRFAFGFPLLRYKRFHSISRQSVQWAPKAKNYVFFCLECSIYNRPLTVSFEVLQQSIPALKHLSSTTYHFHHVHHHFRSCGLLQMHDTPSQQDADSYVRCCS